MECTHNVVRRPLSPSSNPMAPIAAYLCVCTLKVIRLSSAERSCSWLQNFQLPSIADIMCCTASASSVPTVCRYINVMWAECDRVDVCVCVCVCVCSVPVQCALIAPIFNPIACSILFVDKVAFRICAISGSGLPAWNGWHFAVTPYIAHKEVKMLHSYFFSCLDVITWAHGVLSTFSLSLSLLALSFSLIIFFYFYYRYLLYGFEKLN